MMVKYMSASPLPPEALEALQQSMETTRATMRSIASAEAEAALIEGCTQALDSLVKSQSCGAAP